MSRVHPSTATRQAAHDVIRAWTGEPGPLLAWALGAVWCGHDCLTATWDGGAAAHRALHRQPGEIGAFGYALYAERAAARVRLHGAREITVSWDDVSAVIGAAPGPDLRVVAAAIRVLVETSRDVGGQAERDLRVLALQAWEVLRPGLLDGAKDALFAGAPA